jgi:DNA polymerase-4
LPDFARYKSASQAIFNIYREYSDLIEPLSLDEAYLDVSHCQKHQGSATLIAQEIRARVKSETDLVVSAGVAPNKFLAKIASDWDKPDGLYVIRPQDVDGFVAQLPVEKLFGVGPRTAEKMHRLKLFTCADVRTRDLPFLRAQFGKLGTALYQSARGIDNREVKSNRVRKSISVETTFAHDLHGFADCMEKLPALHADLIARIERNQALPLVYKTFVKLRMADFKVRTVEVNEGDISARHFEQLLENACQKHTGDIRLIRLGVRLRAPDAARQLDLLG